MPSQEFPLRMEIPIEQPCSTGGCSSTKIETISVGRIQQPDPRIFQYSYSGFCPQCRAQRAGFFFLKGDDLTVELALNSANASACAQEIVNAWGLNVRAGNSSVLTPAFMDVFDKACRYQQAKQQADSYRRLNALHETGAEAEETAARQLFAEAFTEWCDQHS
jgi:hypothetical protein